jgi:hypothetical protein
MLVLGVAFGLIGGCSGEPPSEAIEAAAKVAEAAGVELPLDPAKLEQLTQSLGELTAFVEQAQSSKLRFETASSQGRARMIQRQLRQFLDGLEHPLPFRGNLERIVEILSESSGDELSESDRDAIRQEVQEIRDELGLSESGDDGFPGGFVPPAPGPPGPPGPPRPPGPP